MNETQISVTVLVDFEFDVEEVLSQLRVNQDEEMDLEAFDVPTTVDMINSIFYENRPHFMHELNQ